MSSVITSVLFPFPVLSWESCPQTPVNSPSLTKNLNTSLFKRSNSLCQCLQIVLNTKTNKQKIQDDCSRGNEPRAWFHIKTEACPKLLLVGPAGPCQREGFQKSSRSGHRGGNQSVAFKPRSLLPNTQREQRRENIEQRPEQM